MTFALRSAFAEQASYCERLDSPFMGRLMRLLAKNWPDDTKLAVKLAAWVGGISLVTSR